MQQYFIDVDEPIDMFEIVEQDAHHIIKVMRMKLGAEILVVVNQQRRYLCEITEIDDKLRRVLVKKLKVDNRNTELSIAVTIVLGLLKSDKFEYAIQKLTEIGVTKIIPWQADFSIVKRNDKNEHKKILRWQTIAKEAAEQSKRLQIPKITEFKNLTEILQEVEDNTTNIVAFEQLSGQRNLLDIKSYQQNICFFIGPEGGISQAEIRQFEAYQTAGNDVQFISLGSRILRAETAAIFAMSLCAGKNEELI